MIIKNNIIKYKLTKHKQRKKNDKYIITLLMMYCNYLNLICNSLNCSSVISEGDPIKLSAPLALVGNA